MLRSYTVADALTIGNAACGTVSIFLCLEHVATGSDRFLWIAFLLLPIALICDILDGFVARASRTRQSVLGGDLDSLADVISFGVAPAVIAFAAGADGPLDQAVLIFFALCGLSRLARYNVTAESLTGDAGKVKYFEGTPIPTSVVPLALLMIAFHHRNLLPVNLFGVEFHLLSLVFFVSGCLMISKSLHIPKL